MKSINILYIESVSGEPNNSGYGDRAVVRMSYKTEVLMKLQYKHPETMETMSDQVVRLRAGTSDFESGFMQCLQDLFNGRFHPEIKVYGNIKKYCEYDRENIHHIEFSHFNEPYLTFFRQVFTGSNWKIQQAIGT